MVTISVGILQLPPTRRIVNGDYYHVWFATPVCEQTPRIFGDRLEKRTSGSTFFVFLFFQKMEAVSLYKGVDSVVTSRAVRPWGHFKYSSRVNIRLERWEHAAVPSHGHPSRNTHTLIDMEPPEDSHGRASFNSQCLSSECHNLSHRVRTGLSVYVCVCWGYDKKGLWPLWLG